jgi:hypothetical protein
MPARDRHQIHNKHEHTHVKSQNTRRTNGELLCLELKQVVGKLRECHNRRWILRHDCEADALRLRRGHLWRAVAALLGSNTHVKVRQRRFLHTDTQVIRARRYNRGSVHGRNDLRAHV